VDKLHQLTKPLAALARKNEPEAFTREGRIDMALFSEAGIAEFIAAGLGGRLLWCEPAGWFVYDETSGAFITHHAEDVIYELIKIYRDKILSLIPQLVF
jgi:hypothetical protein